MVDTTGDEPVHGWRFKVGEVTIDSIDYQLQEAA